MFAHNRDHFRRLRHQAELIFVDGGSEDKSREEARALGKLLTAPKGRARQMNAGARAARHDVLLFLHADTYLPPEGLQTIRWAVDKKGLVGGCFRQVIDQPGPVFNPGLLFRWIAFTGNVRARLFKVFYGDQGIFVRRDVFEKLGGFPETPLCEDVLFSRRLRKEGRVRMLPSRIYCSARRWVGQGIGRTFWLNLRITAGALLSADMNRLAKAYKDIR